MCRLSALTRGYRGEGGCRKRFCALCLSDPPAVLFVSPHVHAAGDFSHDPLLLRSEAFSLRDLNRSLQRRGVKVPARNPSASLPFLLLRRGPDHAKPRFIGRRSFVIASWCPKAATWRSEGRRRMHWGPQPRQLQPLLRSLRLKAWWAKSSSKFARLYTRCTRLCSLCTKFL